MIDKTKIFNNLLLAIICILIIMSLLAIITIHWTLFTRRIYIFSFSPTGINNYLIGYGTYKALFTGTVATIAAYIGLLRYKAATEANKDKVKQDMFSEWKNRLDYRLIEIEMNGPYLKRIFTDVRLRLFNRVCSKKCVKMVNKNNNTFDIWKEIKSKSGRD